MPTTLADSINNQIDKATTEARNNIVEQKKKSTTLTIMRAGTAIAIYIVARLLLFIISIFAKELQNYQYLSKLIKQEE